jgi:hypothetical protein
MPWSLQYFTNVFSVQFRAENHVNTANGLFFAVLFVFAQYGMPDAVIAAL